MAGCGSSRVSFFVCALETFFPSFLGGTLLMSDLDNRPTGNYANVQARVTGTVEHLSPLESLLLVDGFRNSDEADV